MEREELPIGPDASLETAYMTVPVVTVRPLLPRDSIAMSARALARSRSGIFHDPDFFRARVARAMPFSRGSSAMNAETSARTDIPTDYSMPQINSGTYSIPRLLSSYMISGI
jgi:hypothetical protein